LPNLACQQLIMMTTLLQLPVTLPMAAVKPHSRWCLKKRRRSFYGLEQECPVLPIVLGTCRWINFCS
jgi:hypothetical protein